jgi:DNA repair protein RecO (recombination protein O)
MYMAAPRTYRTDAIVLRSSIFAERDRMLVLFTPTYGKLRVLAKGARRTASRLAGHVGVFTYSNLFVVHGRTFDLVTQGATVQQFPSLHTDLWRVSHAFYAAELVERFTEEQHSVPGLFEALLLHLNRLNQPQLDVNLAARAFELELLGLAGYRPELFRCTACAAEIKPEVNGFSFRDGGALCPDCAAKSSTAFPIGVEALKILRNLQIRPEVTIARLQPSPEALNEAEHAIIGYIQYLLDLRLRSTGFLDAVRSLRAVVGTS